MVYNCNYFRQISETVFYIKYNMGKKDCNLYTNYLNLKKRILSEKKSIFRDYKKALHKIQTDALKKFFFFPECLKSMELCFKYFIVI